MSVPKLNGRKAEFRGRSARLVAAGRDFEAREVLRSLGASEIRSRAEVARLLGLSETRVLDIEKAAIKKIISTLRNHERN